MDCKFVNRKCIECGYDIPSVILEDNPLRTCPAKKDSRFKCGEVKEPNWIQKAVNFTQAVGNDIYTGMKRCTQEEIDERMNICQKCEFFIKKDDNSGVCGKPECGCSLSREKIYLNKLHWKNEKCPDNRW